MTFFRKEPFTLHASYSLPNTIPFSRREIGPCSFASSFLLKSERHLSGVHVCLGDFTIKNVSPTNDGEARKVKAKVRINPNGVFTVSSATTIEKIMAMPEEVKAEEEEDAEKEKTEGEPLENGASKEEATPEKMEDEQVRTMQYRGL